MKTLVFNCGSSSLKYKLIDMPAEKIIAAGEAQRVGPVTSQPSRIIHNKGSEEAVIQVEMKDHKTAFGEVMKLLMADKDLVPDIAGHRMVHGGQFFTDVTIVDDKTLDVLDSIMDLAPLHNPPATQLVKACRKMYPDLPQAVVFDTAYHSTIPDYAKTYCLPEDILKELGLRKYGFHGTSHWYVAQEAAKFLNIKLENLNAVSCHLGSGGASLCAISNGKSIDNTMGYSPLQGLVMSTRCGDLDPTVTLKLITESLGDTGYIEKLLNKKSGVLGLSGGMSADIRDIFAKTLPGDSSIDRLDLTVGLYLWRIRKYLGSYLACTGNVKTVIFTDTIGETVPAVRWAVCAGLDIFGIKIDQDKNFNVKSMPADISCADSYVRILVIQTNEELAIARRSYIKFNEAHSAVI